MNARLAKELRSLLLPWSAALIIAILIPMANFLVALQFIHGGVFVSFLLAIATFAFFGDLLAIAALPIGLEFQHRTFQLLLSQPIPRAEVWKHKLIAALIGVATPILILALGHWLAQFASNFFGKPYPGPIEGLASPWETALSAFSLLLPTLGSVGYWTLLARSTLGGMLFTGSAQLIIFGLLAFILDRFGLLLAFTQPPFFAVIGVIYGAIFSILGWRKFARVELRHLSTDSLPLSRSLSAQSSRVAWLRCRATSNFLNLMRKEIQLQRPLFIIAAIWCGLWLLNYTLLMLRRSYQTFSEIILALTMALYVPLTSLLAGCISLGEEKNLGIPAWHLTFPVSILRQWTAKLAVGLATWILLGLVLPFGLTWLGSAITGSRQMESDTWLAMGLFTAAIFVLSFWAMTLFNNTVRAVVATVAIAIAICCSAGLAFWLVGGLMDIRPFARPPILLVAITVVLALIQSLNRFRRLETPRGVIVKYSCALVALTFFVFVGFILFCP